MLGGIKGLPSECGEKYIFQEESFVETKPLHKITLCYLCGDSLCEPISRDHIPPKQFFADAIRKNHNTSKLITVPVHQECNKGFQHDEDYFVATLLPFMKGSYSGDAVYAEILGKFKEGKGEGLIRKILAEFEPSPSGLALPDGKVVKRFEGERLGRVA